MFHTLHITLHLGLGNAKQSQELSQDPVSIDHSSGNGSPLIRQDQATVTLMLDESLGIKALDHVGHARLGDPETHRNIDHTGITLGINQFLDPLKVVLDGRR